MRNFYLITNRPKDPDLKVTSEIRSWFDSHGCRCVLRRSDAEGRGDCRFTDPSDIPPDTDCIIVLGGDGTLIQAARDVAHLGIPLIGVNLGTLGYLTEIDRSSVLTMLDALTHDEYRIENHMMIKGEIRHGDEKVYEDVALNDIVITREGDLRVISLYHYVNETFLSSFRADGVILATPTGSTGYSLSLGGPIISPTATMFLMQPIAPHTLNARSVLLPPESTITVRIGQGRDGTMEHARAYFDADNSYPMTTNDRIIITRADRDVRIVRISDDSFLETLRRKMSVSS